MESFELSAAGERTRLPRSKKPFICYDFDNVGTEPSLGSSGAILVVDDELIIRKLVSAILTGAGYVVFPADSGENALRIFSKHNNEITLLLTDVVAPGMSGPILAEQLTEVYPHLKVIYMSGYHESMVVRRFVLERGLPLLLKPFTADKLLEAVRTAIGPGHRAASAS